MKIAIIGCGYVGQAIAKQWTTAGHQVTVTTTTPEKVSQLQGIAHQVKVLSGDQPEALQELCEGQDVILLAVGSKGRTEANYRQAYLKTAQNLAQALTHNDTVKQVIYTSSYAIVGNHHGAWVDEKTSDKPPHVFAEILLATEQTLKAIATDARQVCILRLGGIYGEGREIKKIFQRAMGQVRPGDGSEYGNWIHLADIVAAIEFAQIHNLSGLFNLVCDEPLPRRELLSRLAEKYALAPVRWDASQPSDRPLNVRVSNQKLKNLGFTFRHPTIEV
ncbi:SDR family oxidoreductase [Picosynechococcus sp. PCC 73109]|uniref:SDR family oxidoreductase n=1 Tax=Picosynechococcus sp. PCC 73109 TaxID=374982 RepID=UPI0007458106|nr:SDR family oxidoreductase [Picosynechococcus sp. PCC 73109]AMA08681.1 NAD(P)-dependent oxidoreductase [Picosynechococcus sp. PCC 73109]